MSTAISQVERWLEDLHDRRRTLELSWQSRKTQLEQCLALALLTTDLRLLEEIYADRCECLSRNSDELGDSEASAQLLLNEHHKLLPEAKVTIICTFVKLKYLSQTLNLFLSYFSLGY